MTSGRIAPEVLAYDGKYFSLVNPELTPPSLEAIAQALSSTCRFGGHTSSFYSVAQHSVLVSGVVPDEYALAGLLHDAAEAYVGDIPSPLKGLLPEFQRVEARVEAAVLRWFGIELPLPEAVKAADLVLLATERRDLMPATARPWPILEGVEPLPDRIVPWPPEKARSEFLRRFRELYWGD